MGDLRRNDFHQPPEEGRGGIARYGNEQKLKEGANILLFPEGRATNGERMLPFQTAPLAAPLRNRSIIVPVTLVYTRVDDKPVSKENRDLIYCYDDMDFSHTFGSCYRFVASKWW